MKKTNGYTIKDNSIILTKAYAKLAYTPGTKEFRELAALHKAFPDFIITQRQAKKNEEKEKHGGLTIDRMAFIIKTKTKSEIAMAQFEAVKAYYKGMSGYYGKVKKWFLDNYPDYQDVDVDAMVASEKPAAQASASEATAA